MANTITLKRRIGSVKNTKQITKAMEEVINFTYKCESSNEIDEKAEIKI